MDPTFISYFHPRTLTVFILFLANSTLQLSVISCNLFLASLVQKFVFDSNIQSQSNFLEIRQHNFLLKNFKNIHSYHFSAFRVHFAVRWVQHLVNALTSWKLSNVWWIKNRTNHRSKTLIRLVRFLLHHTKIDCDR